MSASRTSMARARLSGAGPQIPSSTAQSRLAAPTYEPMEYPLTSKAQRELVLLRSQHDFSELSTLIQNAQSALQEAASEINEKAFYKEHELQKRLRQRENKRRKIKSQDTEDGGGGDEVGADEETLRELEEQNAEFKAKVKAMTKRMDESIRKAIDGAHSIEVLKESLDATAHTMAQNSQRIQLARSQAQREDEENDEEEEDVTQITATNRSRAARDVPLGPEPTKTLRDRLERRTTEYQNMSLTSRYSKHNTYVGFKTAVHDAQHDPSHIPDLPAPRTWFAEHEGEPAPGTVADEADEDASDDDVAVLQAKISTKCPLTLVEFVDPVTSNQCRHSFERTAIEELIRSATNRQNGRSGEKIVQCPVPGCSAKIMQSNLHKDVALLRKIQRIQEHQRRVAEYEDDGGDGDGVRRSGAVNLDSDSGGENDADGQDIDALISDDDNDAARRRSIKRFKSEPRGTQNRRQQSIAAPARSRGPRRVDLDGDTSDEEMDDDDGA